MIKSIKELGRKLRSYLDERSRNILYTFTGNMIMRLDSLSSIYMGICTSMNFESLINVFWELNPFPQKEMDFSD